MAIKFQYNKTALQGLQKQLKIREKALPTLKNKESALRIEVKKAKDKKIFLETELERKIKEYSAFVKLWNEFPEDLLSIDDVVIESKKIAGVKTPILKEVIFKTKEISLFNSPDWIYEGVVVLKDLANIGLEKEFFAYKTAILDGARRKTTQKVNLYEKIQIPGYKEAVLKIKRFMEDEDNLSKSAMKIVKSRQKAEVI